MRSIVNAGIITWALLVLAPVWAEAPTATDDPANLCRDAALAASARTGVPADVLLAISLTETGRRMKGELRPWPWAINHAGTGAWYETEAEAVAAIDALTAQGLRNFDVGCFQLNHRWHAAAFTSATDMIDPVRNADYAARFLLDHYHDTQDWGLAAAAYHSATPEYASQYQARFEAILANLSPTALQDTTFAVADDSIPDRPNAFPLLLAGHSGSAGSLVPLGQTARPLFGAVN
jgi:Transglycosylase SLT domain